MPLSESLGNKMFILLICIVLFATVRTTDDYNAIDLSDILNVDYMPGSLLVLENIEDNAFQNQTTSSLDVFEHPGTFNEALLTMGYHRKMMNEYLCRSYVSDQIIKEMQSTRLRRRLGSPAEKKVEELSPMMRYSLKNNLLDDEGSFKYQEWLKKSATLEDIYRHYDDVEARDDTAGSDRNIGEETNDEYDAHVTGYGYQQPQRPGVPSKLGHSGSGSGYPYHNNFPSSGLHSDTGGQGGVVYGDHSGTGGTYFGGHQAPILTDGGISNHGGVGGGGHGFSGGHDHSPKYHGGSGHKDKLSDIFDIALTALAFLSFGLFIAQVIMCITANTTTTPPAMTMMPMSMGGTDPTGDGTGGMDGGMDGTGTADGADTGAGRDHKKFRTKRDIPTITQPNNEALNELSRKVLISIEAAQVAHQDDGECLHRTLCESNVYSRSLESNHKFWLPVWSLGMSWLSGRLVTSIPRTTSMLDSLKASLLGLGNADCEIIYHKCDLAKERKKRRRRRKRSNK